MSNFGERAATPEEHRALLMARFKSKMQRLIAEARANDVRFVYDQYQHCLRIMMADEFLNAPDLRKVGEIVIEGVPVEKARSTS